MNLLPYRNEVPPHREILPGGAVLLSVPMPAAHAVTMGVFLRSGSQDESAALSGVSHFIEHMVFKGSERFSAFEIASGFDAIGASVDAFTTKDMVAFTIKVLPEYFATGVDLLAEMLLRPTFAPDLVELEQNVVLEEIQEALDTPEDRLHDAFAERIYRAHGRSRPILGSEQNVQGFDTATLRDQHARLFAPDNMIISLAGNLQAGFGELVAGHFGNGRSGGVPAPARAAGAVAGAAPAPGGEPLRLELNSPIIQTYFELGNLAIPFHHPDRLGVYLLNNILGGGMSSRIFQAVREREGLAYTVYTYADMGRDIGLVSCAGSCSPDKVGRLEEIIRREYAALISGGVSCEELDGNRAQLKSQLIFSLEGIVNQMYRSARNEIYYGRFVPVAELVDEIDGVGEDDVIGCARRYFDPDRLLVAVHGPASA